MRAKVKQLGQGMTEYIIIVALVAVAAIAVYNMFGDTVRGQVGDMAAELGGGEATGAGADRVSQGMRCAFGKNVGTAARVQKNQKVITIQTNATNFLAAKDALRKANCKLPSPSTIVVERGHDLLKGLV